MPAGPRLRLVTLAWGEAYVAKLTDLALPALLAPNNLPALIAGFACELVIVTQEAWFERLGAHETIARIRELCPVELRSLDEFVSRPDAYGMALTYALFRGFEELGMEMLDVHLVFFNADFIMADGSLRSVARKIAEGERLILAPSYCVVLENVVPLLRQRRREGGGVLALPPREMAALAIEHRHNTIRGKTVNQRLFSVEWMDQFYWLADERTLLGRQMPIALVCMRPERVLLDMRTYWDYGILSEACPDTRRCVLGDSDEFLMIELRASDAARDQLSWGWPTPKEIADRLAKFTTKDPIELARRPLVLHAGELPASHADAEARLDEFVDAVLRELPPEPPSYIDHPNWVYHYARFHAARRDYLRRREHPDDDEAPRDPIAAETAAAPPRLARRVETTVACRNETPRSLPVRLARAVFGRLFGYMPELTHFHPRQRDAAFISAVLRDRVEDVTLIATSAKLPVRLLRNVPGQHCRLEDIIEHAGNAAVGEDCETTPVLFPPASFDLCLCEVSARDLARCKEIAAALRAAMRPGGAILILHLTEPPGEMSALRQMIERDALALDLPSRVQFGGSATSAAAIRQFEIAMGWLRSRRPIYMIRALPHLVRAAWLARRANGRAPASRYEGGPLTSITIELGPFPAAPARPSISVPHEAVV